MALDPDSFRSTCIHEAGHAVVGWHYRLPIGEIWVDDFVGTDGGTDIAGASCLALEDQVAIWLAGFEAVEVIGCGQVPDGDRADRGEIAKLFAQYAVDGSGTAVCSEARSRARRVLERHRDKIERLATALSEATAHETSEGDRWRELSAAEIAAVLGPQ
jgi:hypothetical protein